MLHMAPLQLARDCCIFSQPSRVAACGAGAEETLTQPWPVMKPLDAVWNQLH